jgi:hypothetical protein
MVMILDAKAGTCRGRFQLGHVNMTPMKGSQFVIIGMTEVIELVVGAEVNLLFGAVIVSATEIETGAGTRRRKGGAREIGTGIDTITNVIMAMIAPETNIEYGSEVVTEIETGKGTEMVAIVASRRPILVRAPVHTAGIADSHIRVLDLDRYFAAVSVIDRTLTLLAVSLGRDNAPDPRTSRRSTDTFPQRATGAAPRVGASDLPTEIVMIARAMLRSIDISPAGMALRTGIVTGDRDENRDKTRIVMRAEIVTKMGTK